MALKTLKCICTMPRSLLETGIAGLWSRPSRLLQGQTGIRYSSNLSSPSESSEPSSESTSSPSSEPSSNNIVSSEFINRNPRNLEQLGLARKRKGWKFQYPPVNYYHRLIFEKSVRYVSARVEHFSGKTVLTASTKEFALAKGLYSTSDASAAENVGRVLAQRCRESGITCMNILPTEFEEVSEKFLRFIAAMEEGGIEFEEPEEFQPPYEPGIDYDNEYEVADLARRQRMASIPLKRLTNYGRTKKPHRSRKSGKNVI